MFALGKVTAKVSKARCTPLVSYDQLDYAKQGLYSQHFMFFVTYNFAQ